MIVSNLIGGAPVGPNKAGCPLALECLPPNSYRVSELNSVSNSVRRPGSHLHRLGRLRNNTKSSVHGLRDECERRLATTMSSTRYSEDEGETWSEPRAYHAALECAFRRDGAVAAVEPGHA